jgi:PAS domain S-box-containing protein
VILKGSNMHTAKGQLPKGMGIFQSPVRLLAIIFISVFISETFVMFFLSVLQPVPMWFEALFDATLLVVLLVPTLYFFVFRPLILHINERKRAEEALEHLSRQNQMILEAAGEGIFGLDLDGKVIFANPAAARMLGYEVGELIGKLHHDKVHHSKQDGTSYPTENCPIYAAYKDGAVHHGKNEVFWRKDGTPIPIEYMSTPIREKDEIRGAVVIFSDVTERKKAEEALQAALRTAEDERLKSKSIIESMGEPLGIIDTNFRFMYQNKIHRDSFGEHIGQICYKAIKDRNEICEGCQLAECFRDGNIHTKERVVPREEGPLYVVNTASPLRDSTGNIVAGIELIRDITEWRRAEEALRENEEKLSAMLLSIADHMSMMDKNLNIIWANDIAKKIFGDEIIGKKCYEAYHKRKEPCEPYPCLTLKAFQDGKVHEHETQVMDKDGNILYFHCTANVALRDKEGIPTAVIEISRDITSHKKLEGQLIQAQKMEAVGQLAGGVAHDFNNILTAIIGFGNLLQGEVSKDDLLNNYITKILNSAQKAANLTQSLLAFSREQIISPKPVNLNEIIQMMERLLSRLISEDIELSTVLTDEYLTVMADSTQIETVLMNLTTNARDAMPDGGSLTIRTERIELDHEFIKAHGYGKAGSYALISVEDTGEGIDEKMKERIFEPFFTTKEVGKGTGLGLAMVYGIIKQHAGYINVYSEPGMGTTFKIYLPLIKSKVKEEEVAAPPILKRGTETVVVAEDDTLVREFIKEVLEGFGYKVIEAEDGEETLKVFNENRDKIQLLILDVVMPKKNGKEVYDEIRKLRPDIKAIFTSGYNADIIHKKGILEEGLNFILKPVLPQELLKKAREVLDK